MLNWGEYRNKPADVDPDGSVSEGEPEELDNSNVLDVIETNLPDYDQAPQCELIDPTGINYLEMTGVTLV